MPALAPINSPAVPFISPHLRVASLAVVLHRRSPAGVLPPRLPANSRCIPRPALTGIGALVLFAAMFTIIGGDGKEYGPVTLEQIREWIAAGRANLDTKAKPAGSSDDWKRLGDLPEFNGNPTPPRLDSPYVPPEPMPATARTVEVVTADRGLRLVAVLLDGLVTSICALPGLFSLGTGFLGIVLAASRGQPPDLSAIDAGQMLLGFALLGSATFALAIVQIVMISTRGQTIGKRIVGIRIVRCSTGALPGFVHGWLLRSCLIGIIGLVPVAGSIFSLVDICFIFGANRRCIHDLMADTKVVKV